MTTHNNCGNSLVYDNQPSLQEQIDLLENQIAGGLGGGPTVSDPLKRKLGTAPVVGNVMLEGVGGLDNTSSTISGVVLQSQLVGSYVNPLTLDARLALIETAQTTFDDVLVVTTLPATGVTGKLYVVTGAGVNNNKSFYYNGAAFVQTDNEVQSFATKTLFPPTGQDGLLYIAKTGTDKGTYYWDGTTYQATTTVVAVTNALSSAANSMTSAVNGISVTAPIVNTNVLTIAGTNLSSTINGITSNTIILPAPTATTTNLGTTAITATTIDVTSSTGTATTLPGATTTAAGLMSSSDKVKLNAAIVPTTNILTAVTSAITSTVNGIQATLSPATGTIASTLGFDSTGNLVKQVASASGVTNVSSSSIDLTVATGTSTPVLTVVSAPKLTTPRTINGVAFDGTGNITIVDATKVASVTAGTNITVTGTSANPIVNAVIPATTNALANNGVNSLTSTVNGISSGLQPIVNTVGNASTVNTLTTTVNGVSAAGVPIINSNVISLTAGVLTSTINGVVSNTVTINNTPFSLLNQTIAASGNLAVTHNKNDISIIPTIHIMGITNSPILADFSSADTNNIQITDVTANSFVARNLNSSASITLNFYVK